MFQVDFFLTDHMTSMLKVDSAEFESEMEMIRACISYLNGDKRFSAKVYKNGEFQKDITVF